MNYKQLIQKLNTMRFIILCLVIAQLFTTAYCITDNIQNKQTTATETVILPPTLELIDDTDLSMYD